MKVEYASGGKNDGKLDKAIVGIVRRVIEGRATGAAVKSEGGSVLARVESSQANGRLTITVTRGPQVAGETVSEAVSEAASTATPQPSPVKSGAKR